MSLMYAKYPYAEPIEKGVKLVMSRQRPDGSWPQEAIEGVFNKTCAIAYPNFKFSFPIWMLGKAHHYLHYLRGKNTAPEVGYLKKTSAVNGNGVKNGHANGHSNSAANGNGKANGKANGNGVVNGNGNMNGYH